MAALTDAEITVAARELARVIFVEANVIAHSDVPTLKAMIEAIDDAMEELPTALPNQSATIQANLNQLALAAGPNSTLSQRAIALQIWAAKKAGII